MEVERPVAIHARLDDGVAHRGQPRRALLGLEVLLGRRDEDLCGTEAEYFLQILSELCWR